MLMVISPAKTLDYESPLPALTATQPAHLDQSALLIERLRQLSVQDVASLMTLSDKLAALNVARYADWQPPFTEANARPALYAFKGDVYTGLAVERLSPADVAYAQRQLRMLSGLYGLLRPLDLMQPYRLEMGTDLANGRGRNLYEFWGDRITDALNEALAEQGDDILINLASNEYFRAVRPARLKARIFTPQFKDEKNGQYKIISFYAKKARGLMAAWIIQNRISTPADLHAFDVDGYRYNPEQSSEREWVFTRSEHWQN